MKILPDAFAADPDRLARFKREAQILASLNHLNIAAIYGIEEAEGTRALVLELVEGPTLADRISKGPIPLDEASGKRPRRSVSRPRRSTGGCLKNLPEAGGESPRLAGPIQGAKV